MLSGGAMRIIFGLLLVLCWSTAASSQALKPGDTISISVYQDPKLDRQVLIGPSGMISFPLAGQIRAGGMTPEALETVLKSKLKDKFTEEPDITVSLVAPAVPPSERQVEEDLKPRIFITGEVTQAGLFHRKNETYCYAGRSDGWRFRAVRRQTARTSSKADQWNRGDVSFRLCGVSFWSECRGQHRSLAGGRRDYS